MSRIRGTNTKPELIVKKMMDGRVFRYQPKGILGNPDFANKRKKIAVFVDGCFWHKCPACYKPPSSNRKFWNEKIRMNVERDKKANLSLRKAGWMVVRVWEHEIKERPQLVVSRIARKIKQLS